VLGGDQVGEREGGRQGEGGGIGRGERHTKGDGERDIRGEGGGIGRGREKLIDTEAAKLTSCPSAVKTQG
jgi:hypothetical protein